ncbi:Competence protein ComGF [Psychrobacillus sp. OK028]|uniref:competence type IV pilus minor pilin ComGF n=1 Tax=Psychrobacillus sp. OK028 TaxID=1884359 RepID=UPI00088E4094|nr:competence type IV pilus minor pilin ComGF [Psychrobacillus sp. OK028]SDM86929.1 Competence protein ComGF [Psychrobacillus sp. OK028]
MCTYYKMKIRDQSGYTLLEGILHLAIFMLFAQVLAGTMWWLTKTETAVTDTTEIEWALFIQYVDSFITDLESIRVNDTNSGIIIKKNHINYKVEHYKDLIRKQKNWEGHEQMLLNVNSLFVELEGNVLRLKVNFVNDIEKEQVFYVTYHTE